MRTTTTLELVGSLSERLTSAADKLGYLLQYNRKLEPELMDILDDVLTSLAALQSFLYEDVGDDEDEEAPDFSDIEADKDLDFNDLQVHSAE